MLELYNASVSTCSQRVRMALAEKGLDWVDRRLSLPDNEHLSPAYLAINPNGLVPTLVHDGRAIADSSVIMEYLEDVFPSPALRPSDPFELARMRVWTHYIDEVPTAATRIPSFHHVFGLGLRRLPRPVLEDVAAQRPLRKHMYLRMGPDGFGRQDLAEAMEQIEQSLARAEGALADGPWLNGAAFSLADISMLPTVVRMEDLGFAHLWAQRPRVADWYARMTARPSFQAAYYPGSRVSPPPAVGAPAR
ncbi:glutathione S-transferase [Pigmentiphaga sp. NML080357]|uniref:glutathione S-transferase family protein n=1 Tax=Pigmentiphaga sp. NML080357 TaxID=2008675 RepID=UPI000B42167F|nr:glutathione S-transferase family protein [Pigmentiphaga sp. NML080357]OVZ54777.1 glutathione S-transferase [Pigmentiphaga sp. NML080357]